jgi:1-acyl-sn-glycerol-3-phosphate acyltransferase
MTERIGRYWRVVATAIGFAWFGLAGLVLRVLLFPLLAVVVHPRAARLQAARGLIRYTLRAFIGMLRVLGILRYEFVGLDKLARSGLLIVANHPTLIDTCFLMAFVKNADCIVKSALVRNPFTGGAVRTACYLSNDQGAQLVEDGIVSLRAGSNLIIFPEGSRTPASGAKPLKRGAANIAVRGGIALTPIRIRCRPTMLAKGVPWWQVPLRRSSFHIEVGDDIEVARFTEGGVPEPIAARRLTGYLQQYFAQESANHA